MPTEDRPAVIVWHQGEPMPSFPSYFYALGNMLDKIEAAQFEIDALAQTVQQKSPLLKPLGAVLGMMHHVYHAHHHMLAAYSRRHRLPDLDRLGKLVADRATLSMFAGDLWETGEALKLADAEIARLFGLFPYAPVEDATHWAHLLRAEYVRAGSAVGRCTQASAETLAPIQQAMRTLGFQDIPATRN